MQAIMCDQSWLLESGRCDFAFCQVWLYQSLFAEACSNRRHNVGSVRCFTGTTVTGPSGGRPVCPTSCLETEEGLARVELARLLSEPVLKDNEVHPAAWDLACAP